MFDAIRRIFGKPVPTRASTSPAELNAFLRQLGDSDILIIAAIQGDGIDPKGLTPEQLLGEIRRNAIDLNERKAFAPFVYEADSQRRLPFFTSNDYAQKFVGEYS